MFTARHGFAVDLEPTFDAIHGMGDNLAARTPAGRVYARSGGSEAALCATGGVYRPDAVAGLAGGREGQLTVVRRPAGHHVLGGIAGELADLATAQIQHENVVVAAQRVPAIGRKGDPGA